MSTRFLIGFSAAACLLLSSACSRHTGQMIPATYRLVHEQSFDRPQSFSTFTFTDPAVWKYAAEADGGSLECTGKASYEPPVRSPLAIALLAGKQFGNFILEADLMQTGREYNHQDMCVFFGFQDPSHFYYTHISRSMDDNANQIFIVNGAPRTKISTKTNNGNNWRNGNWHKLRIERNVDSGLIRVFFDDMQQPIMEASDKRFGVGGIGFGSFDDSGKIDNIRIWSDRKALTTPNTFYSAVPPARTEQ